jgi:hypothetical protein
VPGVQTIERTTNANVLVLSDVASRIGALLWLFSITLSPHSVKLIKRRVAIAYSSH